MDCKTCEYRKECFTAGCRLQEEKNEILDKLGEVVFADMQTQQPEDEMNFSLFERGLLLPGDI